MYSYKNKKNEIVTLSFDQLMNIAKKNKNLISLAIELDSTVKTARKLLEEIQKENETMSFRLNQYNKWSEEEDIQLENEYKNNMSIKQIGKIHGRTSGGIRSRLKHKNLYIEDNNVENYTTKNYECVSGVFKIRFENEKHGDVYFYNINEKDDNIDSTRPIFGELFNTEIGEFNEKYNFFMIDKTQYIPERKVEKEPVFFDKKIIYDLEIYHLTEYFPKWSNKSDDNSSKILDLKSKYLYAIDYYYKLTYKWLEDNNLLNENTIIAVVPSHKASEENYSGISKVAKKIVDNSKVIDGINLVIRKDTVYQKSSSLYKRSLNQDISSLDINKDIDISEKTVVVLDDVTTRGNSFRAVAYHLYLNGVNRIIPLAMGKTVVSNE